MVLKCLLVSLILIVLSLVQINAQCTRPDVPFCQFVECENGGDCIDDKTISDCYKCRCRPGFSGQFCEMPITTPTGCDPPCQNGGACEQTPTNTHVCVCPANYTGNQCETSVFSNHQCITMPTIVCQNGGTCTMTGNDYVCICSTGWTGTNCNIQGSTTSCNPNPCGAHGTCTQSVGASGPSVTCNCENNWVGQFCETFIDTSSTTTTTTTANPMTTTTRTTSRPTQGSCSSNPCLNGGNCYNNGDSFICLCKPQWTGSTCNMATSSTTTISTTSSSTHPCTPNPCNNGGDCYRHANSFVCVCKSQYTGPTCDLIKSTTTTTTVAGTITCAQQPCKNGGFCYDTGASYFCYCGANTKFTGKDCETPIAAIPTDCPLQCAPGYCVRTGTNTHACMCNGVLTPTRCTTK